MYIGQSVQYRYKVPGSNARNIGKVIDMGGGNVTVRFLGGGVVTREKQSFYPLRSGLREAISGLLSAGHTYLSLSEALNRIGYTTVRGKKFTPYNMQKVVEAFGLKTVRSYK